MQVRGDFEIGDSRINPGVFVACDDHVSIGDDCEIAWNCTLMDTNWKNIRTPDGVLARTEPIVIEDDVWIGHDCTIKKGVTVGTGAIVAGDSVVTEDVPPHTLVAGQPATVRRRNVAYSGEKVPAIDELTEQPPEHGSDSLTTIPVDD